MVYPTDDGGFRLNLEYFDFHIYGHSKMLSDKAMHIFDMPRSPDGEILQYHKDVAAALQKRVRSALRRYLRNPFEPHPH